MSYMELIERVKPHQYMWQNSHPLFKNKVTRAKFWKRLSKELNTHELQLKKNWKYLIDQYRREYKKISAQEISIGETVTSGWAYYEALSFLKPGLASKQQAAAVVQPSSDSDNNEPTDYPQLPHGSFPIQYEDNNDCENSSWQYTAAKQAKRGPSKADLVLRKLEALNTTILNSQADLLKNDEDYMFFMSVLPMVRTMPLLKKLELRGMINTWMMKALTDREPDPLNNTPHYSMTDEEDNKEAVKDHIIAAEDDD